MVKGPWELINGPVADEIEDLNRATLANVTLALVASRLERHERRARRGAAKPPIPNEADLLLLHEAATRFLLRKPGQYRTCDVFVEDKARDFVLWGAPQEHVKRLMRRFFRDLTSQWTTGDPLDIAAYALWRIVSIHPFRHGNGRTANAFSYACLCLKLGALLPGNETMMVSIPENPEPYWDALTIAHKSAATGTPDFSALKDYLDGLLLRQVRASTLAGRDHAG